MALLQPSSSPAPPSRPALVTLPCEVFEEDPVQPATTNRAVAPQPQPQPPHAASMASCRHATSRSAPLSRLQLPLSPRPLAGGQASPCFPICHTSMLSPAAASPPSVSHTHTHAASHFRPTSQPPLAPPSPQHPPSRSYAPCPSPGHPSPSHSAPVSRPYVTAPSPPPSPLPPPSPTTPHSISVRASSRSAPLRQLHPALAPPPAATALSCQGTLSPHPPVTTTATTATTSNSCMPATSARRHARSASVCHASEWGAGDEEQEQACSGTNALFMQAHAHPSASQYPSARQHDALTLASFAGLGPAATRTLARLPVSSMSRRGVAPASLLYRRQSGGSPAAAVAPHRSAGGATNCPVSPGAQQSMGQRPGESGSPASVCGGGSGGGRVSTRSSVGSQWLRQASGSALGQLLLELQARPASPLRRASDLGPQALVSRRGSVAASGGHAAAPLSVGHVAAATCGRNRSSVSGSGGVRAAREEPALRPSPFGCLDGMADEAWGEEDREEEEEDDDEEEEERVTAERPRASAPVTARASGGGAAAMVMFASFDHRRERGRGDSVVAGAAAAHATAAAAAAAVSAASSASVGGRTGSGSSSGLLSGWTLRRRLSAQVAAVASDAPEQVALTSALTSAGSAGLYVRHSSMHAPASPPPPPATSLLQRQERSSLPAASLRWLASIRGERRGKGRGVAEEQDDF